MARSQIIPLNSKFITSYCRRTAYYNSRGLVRRFHYENMDDKLRVERAAFPIKTIRNNLFGKMTNSVRCDCESSDRGPIMDDETKRGNNCGIVILLWRTCLKEKKIETLFYLIKCDPVHQSVQRLKATRILINIIAQTVCKSKYYRKSKPSLPGSRKRRESQTF